MIKISLTNSENSKQLAVAEGFTDEECLMIATYGSENGLFKTGTVNNGTTTIVQPGGNDAIALTDIIVSSDKLNNGTVTLDFYDGTYAEIILKANIDFGLAITIPLVGKWIGWQTAYIRLTASGAADAYAAIGYFKVREDKALAYDAWNALR